MLPVDVAVSPEFKGADAARYVDATDCPETQMILDAGPKTVARITEVIDNSRTLVMNGPLGVCELPPYNMATFAMLDHIARRTADGALISVAGGGDTVAAINASDHGGDLSYVSTAGGAFLEWMEGKTLPGVAALG